MLPPSSIATPAPITLTVTLVSFKIFKILFLLYESIEGIAKNTCSTSYFGIICSRSYVVPTTVTPLMTEFFLLSSIKPTT